MSEPTRRRPRSQPPRFRYGRVPRRWRHRLEPAETKKRRPRGLPGLWTRARRLIWAWPLWAIATVSTAASGQWLWAAVPAFGWLLAYLATPSEQAPVYGLEHETTVRSAAFLPSLVGLTGIPFLPGNAVTILNNGDEFFPAMLAAIRRARKSVTIEAYIYWHGAIGREFALALAERARAGVPVKILLDAVGSSTIGAEILAILERGGCELAWFNPIKWYSLGRFNYRTHRKSLIVDGAIGFTGGAGIADQWTGHAQDPDHWRDMQIRIEGPGVTPLQTGFAQNWLATTRELVSGPAFFPDVKPAGSVAVHAMLSSPATGASAARLLYYYSIVCARRSILIANSYFVPDQAAIDALVDACRRGVDVKILVSGRRNDNWLARHNSVRLYGPLLAAGIRVFEYNRTMLHHKTMVVDGHWATIGTANFDNRSFAFNEESNVSFVDASAVHEIAHAFEKDQALSEEISLRMWRKRGLIARASEFVAAFMRDQV